VALIMHDHGQVYRYDMSNVDRGHDVVAYVLADSEDMFDPGNYSHWQYIGKTFDNMNLLRVWWRYDRLPSLGDNSRKVAKTLTVSAYYSLRLPKIA
jgi:hypothetical protein